MTNDLERKLAAVRREIRSETAGDPDFADWYEDHSATVAYRDWLVTRRRSDRA